MARFTAKQLAELETELLVGASARDAALLVGVEPGEVIRAMRADGPEGRVLRKAEARAKVDSVRVLKASNDWKAHAHFLKVRYPTEYGDHKTVSLEAKKLQRLSRAEVIAELQDQLQVLLSLPPEEDAPAAGTSGPMPKQLRETLDATPHAPAGDDPAGQTH